MTRRVKWKEEGAALLRVCEHRLPIYNQHDFTIREAHLPRDLAGFFLILGGRYALTVSKKLPDGEKVHVIARVISRLSGGDGQRGIQLLDRKSTQDESWAASQLIEQARLIPYRRVRDPDSFIAPDRLSDSRSDTGTGGSNP